MASKIRTLSFIYIVYCKVSKTFVRNPGWQSTDAGILAGSHFVAGILFHLHFVINYGGIIFANLPKITFQENAEKLKHVNHIKYHNKSSFKCITIYVTI